jgi:hypothetical protein
MLHLLRGRVHFLIARLHSAAVQIGCFTGNAQRHKKTGKCYRRGMLGEAYCVVTGMEGGFFPSCDLIINIHIHFATSVKG